MLSVSDLTAIINQLLPEPHAGLLSGILFGTKATLSKQLTDGLIATGTIHIVALSGTNITILSSFILTILTRFLSRILASLGAIVCIVGFVLFVGVSPSVVRAAIMGILALIATAFGRQYWAIFSLCVSALGMVGWNHAWITDIGFQLSFAATLGIILFGKPSDTQKAIRSKEKAISDKQEAISTTYRVSRIARFFYSLIQDDLRLTLAAQVFTIPLIFFTFHQVSFVAPLTNILIAWTVPVIMALGFIAVIVGIFWLPLGMMVALPMWVLLQYLIVMVDMTAKLPFSSVRW